MIQEFLNGEGLNAEGQTVTARGAVRMAQEGIIGGEEAEARGQ